MRKFKLSKLLAAAAAVILLGACSKSEEYDFYDYNAEIVFRTIGYDQTSNTIRTKGNPAKSYTAIIANNAQSWCWFEGKNAVLTGSPGETITVYVSENDSDTDRTASITVSFTDADSTSQTLEFTQRGNSGNTGNGGNTGSVSIVYPHDWGEQPEKLENDDFVYKTYYINTTQGVVRNYSICYDLDAKVSRWVAYPLCKAYTDGNVGRADAWAFDDAVTEKGGSNPYNKGAYSFISNYDSSLDAYDTYTLPIIPQKYQQNIAPGAYNDREENRPLDLNRGHMLPSASRYLSWEANAQTFYATNMMPQNGPFNQNSWAKLEDKVRSWSSIKDTLFVVVGTVFDEEQGAVRIDSRNRENIFVPSHCFKILLRTRAGNTGKAIWEITDANDLKSIGFIFKNDNSSANADLSEAAISVAEIEEITGFKFFRHLDSRIADDVKQQCNPGDWGL